MPSTNVLHEVLHRSAGFRCRGTVLRAVLLSTAVCASPVKAAATQTPPPEEELRVFYRSPSEPYMAYTDVSNALYRYLAARASAYLDQREQGVGTLRTREDWLERQRRVRATLLRVVGPFPERTPLRPRVTGAFEREELRVEKVVYESVPGYHVTAALFLPADVREPRPGIVYFSGHTELAFRSSAYQHVILNLVRKGFVVLALDPMGQGERLEYIDLATGDTLVRPNTAHHSYSGAQLFLSGNSQASLMIWDGIRAIDYLASRPEVDPTRIGVTGRSGGGTQAAYVAAFDDRVVAAAPENYITSLRRLWQTRGPQDAEQNFYHGIASGLDHADLLLARAPRPTLLITTTRDIFSIQGSRDTYDEVKRAYAAFGEPEALQRVEDDAGHESTLRNREALYAFFQDALRLPGDPHDEAVTPIPVDSLRVSRTGLVLTSYEGETTFTLARAAALARLEALRRARQEGDGHLRTALLRARELSGYVDPGEVAESIFAGRYQREGYAVEKYILPSRAGYPLPFLLMVPEGEGPHPALIYLHPDGKHVHAAPGGEMERLVRQGYIVAALDLLGRGELGPGLFRGDSYDLTVGSAPYGAWFGAVTLAESFVGLQAADIVRLLRTLRNRSDVSDEPVRGVAIGVAASALLHAAAFEPEIGGIALVGPLTSYASLATTQYYRPEFIPGAVAGMLTAYDLPDLLASLAPRPTLILNPVGAPGGPLILEDARAELAPAIDWYGSGGAEGALRLQVGVAATGDEVLRWLTAAEEGT